MAKLIGNNPDQVPTNGDLGTLAFQDSDNVIVENLTSSKLVVEDNSTDAALRVTQTGTGNALVVEDSANPDSTPFVVDGIGNVGIGTNSPSVNLEIASDSPTLRLKDTDTTLSDSELSSQIEFYQSDTSGSGVGASIGAYGQGSTGLLDLRFATGSNSEAMRIDSSGNVGIGTDSPRARLHVSNSYLSSATVSEIALATYSSVGSKSSSGGYFLGYGVNDGGGQTTFNSTTAVNIGRTAIYTSSGHIYFATGVAETTTVGSPVVNMSERMRIDSSGNVGIGVTSVSYQLQLSTDSAGKPSTTTWTVVSDERIKENIELADLDLCYDAVKNIPLKRFKWRDEVYSESQVADRHKLGWIAQDVESVYPKAVNIHEFKYNQVYNETIIPAVEEELDEDGNIITEAQEERIEKELVSEDVIEDCRNLNADQIYAAMYGAIQKLIQKVETLETRIEALEA